MLIPSTDGPFSVVYEGPEREYQCENLTPGQTYRLKVFCTSRGGESPVSIRETQIGDDFHGWWDFVWIWSNEASKWV